ncbi:glycoside hydrolase domain-containing protein [Nocardioides sp.]|uniref:glycoside hydrolase domain-containing protein n=1 Tax=Nocardioides sp. TaxID=35761 RepID=UPI0037837D8D
MHPPARHPLRRTLAVLAGSALAVGLLTTATTGGQAVAEGPGRTAAVPGKATATNPVTPGDFTGYGFDQCHTPDQATMDRWLQSSPFLAVGVYMSGASRACRDQPNLTATWVQTQLARGWRILPITLGPQASCQPRFPRYGNDPKISPLPGKNNWYGRARSQGRTEAGRAVNAATALRITPGSTLWYDLEGFDLGNRRCRESALAFLSAWSTQIRALGYVSGVYSSAGSGIKMLDDARYTERAGIALPDQIWLARWDGRADTTTEARYLRADGWQPHARVKQYQGGHDERWGGVTINIDRDFLDVGQGSVGGPERHCNGVRISLGRYPVLVPANETQKPPRRAVKVLQCLLQEAGMYRGKLNSFYGNGTQQAAQAWQARTGAPVSTTWSTRNWMSLLVAGDHPVLKYGSAGPVVRRVQRALNAAVERTAPLHATGVFDATLTIAVKAYQKSLRLEQSGVVSTQTWRALMAGRVR